MILDTHVLIWLLNDDRRLGPTARAAIERAINAGAAAISAASVYELNWLSARGRIAFPDPLPKVFEHISAAGISVEALDGPTAAAAAWLLLPSSDPLDRLILAVSVKMDVPLVTADGKLLAATYSVLDARL